MESLCKDICSIEFWGYMLWNYSLFLNLVLNPMAVVVIFLVIWLGELIVHRAELLSVRNQVLSFWTNPNSKWSSHSQTTSWPVLMLEMHSASWVDKVVEICFFEHQECTPPILSWVTLRIPYPEINLPWSGWCLDEKLDMVFLSLDDVTRRLLKVDIFAIG